MENSRQYRKEVTENLKSLSPSQIKEVWGIVGEMVQQNERLNQEEESLVKTLGYNPTSYIADHEWEAQLKRNKLSLEMESKKK